MPTYDVQLYPYVSAIPFSCVSMSLVRRWFLVSLQMTFADVHFLAVIEMSKTLNPLVLKPFPKLAALEKLVAEQPRIAVYLKNRVQTQR